MHDIEKRQCVLWMPTLFHKELKPIVDEKKPAFSITKNTYKGNVIVSKKEFDIYRRYEKVLIDGKERPNPNKDVKLDKFLASDDEAVEVYLEITLLEEKDKQSQKRNILIEATYEGKQIDQLTLICVDPCKNGLVLYEYEVPEYSSKSDKIKYILNHQNNIIDAVYHAIKSFYHVHQCHPSGDAILTPFSCEKNPSDSKKNIELRQSNNPALFHYLSQFEEIFLNEHALIKENKEGYDPKLKKLNSDIDCLSDAIEKCDDTKKTTLLDEKSILQNKLYSLLQNEYKTHLLDECNNTLNTFSYYQALFFSKYNTLFDYKAVKDSLPKEFELRKEWKDGRVEEYEVALIALLKDPNDPQRKVYKKALNIRVAIDSIRHQKREIANVLSCEYNKVLFHTAISQGEQSKRLSNLSTELSSKITRRWAWIGVAISIVVSLAFFVITKYYIYSPEPDIQTIKNNQMEILNQINDYKNTISKQSLIIQELQKSVDAFSSDKTAGIQNK